MKYACSERKDKVYVLTQPQLMYRICDNDCDNKSTRPHLLCDPVGIVIYISIESVLFPLYPDDVDECGLPPQVH